MERHYRVKEVSEMTGLAVSTIRKKLTQREVSFRKSVRAVMIPESEVRKLLGEFRPAIGRGAAA